MFVLITVGNHSLSSSEDAFIMKGCQSTKLLLLLAFLFEDIIQLYTGHTPYRVYSDTLYTGYTVIHYTGYRVYTVIHHTGYTVIHYTGYRVYTVIHHTGYTVIHHTGYTVIHHTGYTVIHYTGYTVIHYTGYTVIHYTGYTVIHYTEYTLYRVYTIQGALYRVSIQLSNDESIVFCGSHVFYLSFFFK